jgi:outer membrane protein
MNILRAVRASRRPPRRSSGPGVPLSLLLLLPPAAPALAASWPAPPATSKARATLATLAQSPASPPPPADSAAPPSVAAGSAASRAAAAAQQPPGLGLLESVRLMLANDPNLVLAQARLLGAQGALSVQKGTFDTVATASTGYTDTRTPVLDFFGERQTALTTSLGFSQELRSGLTISPEVDLVSSNLNAAASGGVQEGIVNTAAVAFTLRQPLLRGRGAKAADAGERAARREAEATSLDLRFTVAQRILAVAGQYWTAVAARVGLDLLRAHEDSERQLLVTTRRLIAADVTPAAEAVQLEADLASAEAARIAGENQLFKARQDLGREIGLDGPRTAALAIPADPMPRADAAAGLEGGGGGAARFTAAAQRLRPDVQAASLRLDEAETLLTGAENALLPQLDLVLRPNYSGLMGGGGVAAYLAPLVHQIPGLSSSLMLDLTWPVRNDTAYGQLLQARSSRQQNAALLEQLRKSLGTDVPTAVDTVARSAQQLERATQSVRLFERAVANEERKLAAGSSTLLDVITQRGRLLAAEQTEVGAELSLAMALVQLRFDTGTLLAAAGGDQLQVEARRIVTVPTAEELGQ